MNRLCLLAVAAVLMFASGAVAQQPTTSPDAHAAVAPVDQHLKMLSEKLGLSTDQEDKARPILQEMHDDSLKIEEDQSLTPEQRHSAMVPVFMKADKAVRAFLTEDQKKKLDEMEAQMHGGAHGDPHGTAARPQAN